MEFKGIIKWISNIKETQGKEGKVYRSLQIMVEDATGQYPQRIVLCITRDEILANFTYQVGDTVSASFYPYAFYWNEKWFNELRVTRMRMEQPEIPFAAHESAGPYPPVYPKQMPTQQVSAPSYHRPQQQGHQPVNESDNGSKGDDLPF